MLPNVTKINQFANLNLNINLNLCLWWWFTSKWSEILFWDTD